MTAALEGLLSKVEAATGSATAIQAISGRSGAAPLTERATMTSEFERGVRASGNWMRTHAYDIISRHADEMIGETLHYSLESPAAPSDGAIYAAASRKNVPDAVIDEAAAEVRDFLAENAKNAPSGDREAVAVVDAAMNYWRNSMRNSTDGPLFRACAALNRARAGSETPAPLHGNRCPDCGCKIPAEFDICGNCQMGRDEGDHF